MRPRATIWGLVSAAGAVTACATVAGFLAPLSWLLELAAHFRVQYFVALTAVSLLLVAARRFGSAAVYACFAVVNLLLILPLYGQADQAAPPSPAPRFRAMLLNVLTANSDHQAVLETVARYDPDVLVIQEINARWLRHLEPLSHSYRHSVHETREDNFGIALFSRLPLHDPQLLYLGDAKVPSVFGHLEVRSGRVAVLGTHALPPANGLYAALRDDQLERVAAFARQVEGALLLLGDLNTSPWSPRFQQLLRDSRLRDSLVGHGVQATWPADFWPLLIPIDHCLYSTGLHVLSREVGPFIGSDHYPVIVEVALAPE